MIGRKFHKISYFTYLLLGDFMKYILKLLRNIVICIFTIYSINVLFSLVNIHIPLNLYTISIGTFLGVFGITYLIILKLFL